MDLPSSLTNFLGNKNKIEEFNLGDISFIMQQI